MSISLIVGGTAAAVGVGFLAYLKTQNTRTKAPSYGPCDLTVSDVKTAPIDGQKPGTSGGGAPKVADRPDGRWDEDRQGRHV